MCSEGRMTWSSRSDGRRKRDRYGLVEHGDLFRASGMETAGLLLPWRRGWAWDARMPTGPSPAMGFPGQHDSPIYRMFTS